MLVQLALVRLHTRREQPSHKSAKGCGKYGAYALLLCNQDMVDSTRTSVMWETTKKSCGLNTQQDFFQNFNQFGLTRLYSSRRNPTFCTIGQFDVTKLAIREN